MPRRTLAPDPIRGRETSALRKRALVGLRELLQSHGWLVFEQTDTRFDLLAFPSSMSTAPFPDWPSGAAWVGITFGEEEHPLDELVDIAGKHGGRAVIATMKDNRLDIRC